MTSANLKLIQTLYATFQKRDLAALTRLIAPEIEIQQSSQLPWGGSYRGVEEFQQFFAKLTENIDSDLSFDNLIDAGEDVVAIGRTTGTVLKNRAKFDVPVVHVWSIRDGRVQRFQPYIDVALMLAALNA